MSAAASLVGTVTGRTEPSSTPDLGPIHRVELAKGIVLHVCPRKEISWEDFQKLAPPNSIALDGIVRGKPQFDFERVLANFNHHQDVDRLATRSTSGQVLVALKQGLMDAFRVNGVPQLNIFINDPDPDSSLAVWLLVNHERFTGTKGEPLINRLTWAEDLIDTAAGAYPFDPKGTLMRELAWIFEPYEQARMSGRVREMDGSEMANVIESVGARVNRYSMGQGDQRQLDTNFERIGGGEGWQMVREIGYYARTGLFHSEAKAFVSFLGEKNGRYHYSVGKMSPYIPFPILELYKALNFAESLDMNSGICWNGGDTVGGSPRGAGSSLPPREVERIINEFLKAWREGRTLRPPEIGRAHV